MSRSNCAQLVLLTFFDGSSALNSINASGLRSGAPSPTRRPPNSPNLSRCYAIASKSASPAKCISITCPPPLRWANAVPPCEPLPTSTSKPPTFANLSPVTTLHRISRNGLTAHPCCPRSSPFSLPTTAVKPAPPSPAICRSRLSTGGAPPSSAALKPSYSASLPNSPRSPSSNTPTSPAMTNSPRSATNPATPSAIPTPPHSSNARPSPNPAATIKSSAPPTRQLPI